MTDNVKTNTDNVTAADNAAEQTSEVNRSSKDSVFVDLFKDRKYVTQLYRDLHPEDTEIVPEDITVHTLSCIMVHGLYNDLGFFVRDKSDNTGQRDKFVVLVEAQSRWNPNISLRIFIYLAETYKRYIYDKHESMHKYKHVNLPCPELYVVYSGNQDVPDEVSFAEEFFNGNSNVDVRVKVLRTVNETIYGQYIGFCRVFDEQRKLYKNADDKIKCVKETIRICKERGYLAEYLSKHESEAIAMLDDLFNEALQAEQYRKSVEKDIKRDREMYGDQREAEGEVKGEAKGIAKGITIGKAEGRLEGEIMGKIKSMRNMMEKFNISRDEALSCAELSLEEYENFLNAEKQQPSI